MTVETQPLPSDAPVADPNNLTTAEVQPPEEHEEAAPQAGTEENPVEEPKDEVKPPEEPKASPRMSKALEQAASNERKNRQRTLELQRAESALKTRAASITAERDAMAAELELASTNPFAFYEKRGVSPKVLAEAFLNHKEPTESAKALQAAEKARAELEAYKQEQKDASEKAQRTAIEARKNAFRQETTNYVTANEDRWELVNKFGAQSFIAERVIDHQRRFGTYLDVDAAADLVEKELEEKLDAVAKTKKFTSKFKLSAESKPPSAPAKPKPSSLTNNVTPSQGAEKRPDLSEDERVKRAMDSLTFGD